MKIRECNITPTHIHASPFIRSKPASYWKEARENGTIPESLFLLYHHADYCSIDKPPKYLADQERKLFSYYGILLNAMCSSFVESSEILSEIIDLEGKDYDPVKKMKGEPWDQNALKVQGRMFKLFIIELVSALDLLSELVCIILPRINPGLRLGKSMYSKLDYWLEQPYEQTGTIVSPKEHFLGKLHKTMNQEKEKGESEKEWYKLLQLFRNKLAHIGNPALRKIVLHDNEGIFYKFIPKSWPFLWEGNMVLPGEEREEHEVFGIEFLERTLIHDDIITFCKSCRLKIFNFIGSACDVLDEAYLQLKDSEVNQESLDDLIGSQREYLFESFVE